MRNVGTDRDGARLMAGGWQGSGQVDRGSWEDDYTHLIQIKSILTIVLVRQVPRTSTHVIDRVQRGMVIEFAYIFCLTTTSQVPIVISVQIYMCTKDRNVYIKFVRVSNNLYYHARYLLRLWCSRMRHGGMVSRGRWDMRWWWFSLTDILIHIIHVIHTYVHTLGWGGDTPAAPTLFRFFWGFF